MKRRPDPVKTSAALVAAQSAAMDAAEYSHRPPTSTLGSSSFNLTVGFRNLTPGTRYQVRYLAHFADGDSYDYGFGPFTVQPNGTLIATIGVAELVYRDPGKPLEWVHVCLVAPTGPPDELIGPDGLPLCVNVETGGYHTDDY